MPSKQVKFLCNGNEAVAKAVVHIGYQGEGYYPITPSSDAGEVIAQEYANGNTDISIVPATSELAAISVCAGFAVAGCRALDVTSANGLLLKIEQLPAISGLRLPMVLNLSTRDVSAPLNIKNGHSDLAACLGMGWLIFTAKTVQEVYDLNIIAIKVSEHPDVQLPAIVAYDGFHTSHGERRIMIFENPEEVAGFVGPKKPKYSVLDVANPKTYGPYMNDDLINTKHQLHTAMEKARKVIPQVFEDFYKLSGRRYSWFESYKADDAETVMYILNSAGEAAKISVDSLREKGQKAGLLIPTVLRPFPYEETVDAVKDKKVIMIAERVDQYGAMGSYLSNEIGAALQRKGSPVKVLSRVYGIGGLNFMAEDGDALFAQALSAGAGKETPYFDYYGAWKGNGSVSPFAAGTAALSEQEFTFNASMGDKVDLRVLSDMPKHIAKHAACPGCGIFVNLELFLKGIDGHVVLGFNTGCGMVVTTGYPGTSFKVNYIHNLFHNGTSTMTGVVEGYKYLKRKGMIKDDITFIAVGGDGSGDIGMDQIIGAAIRDNSFIYLEYDNNIYANTGAQLCYAGLKGMRTSNTPVGPKQVGKPFHHKDIIQIMRGTHAKYIASMAESNPADAIRKARKAQAAVRAGHFAFIKAMSVCPLNWGTPPEAGRKIVDTAVKSCVFPLYEIENGITKLNFDPKDKKQPVTDLFKSMGIATKHLLKPENADIANDIQAEVDRRWAMLKAMNDSPVL